MPNRVTSAPIDTRTHQLDKIVFWSIVRIAIAKAKINGEFTGGPRHARTLDRKNLATKF